MPTWTGSGFITGPAAGHQGVIHMCVFQPGASGEQSEGAARGDDGGHAVLQHDVGQRAAARCFQYGPEDGDRRAAAVLVR